MGVNGGSGNAISLSQIQSFYGGLIRVLFEYSRRQSGSTFSGDQCNHSNVPLKMIWSTKHLRQPRKLCNSRYCFHHCGGSATSLGANGRSYDICTTLTQGLNVH